MPIWFQAIKSANAITSAIMNLPMILGFVIFSILGGGLTTAIGYYIPFIYASIVFMAIGSGLLTTLQVDSGHPAWIGYQFLFGAGAGLALQQPFTAIQTALPLADVAIGTGVIMFSENFLASVFISITQNVFTNQLINNLAGVIEGLDPHAILATGATQLKNQVPEQFFNTVIVLYNKSLISAFYISLALSCSGLLGAIWLEWLSVKTRKSTADIG
jgi:hypothetical protein